MYMYNSDYVVKKRCSWLTILKVVLVLAALAFVAYKIYNKFFKKIKPADATEDATATMNEAEDTFEASAADVLVSEAD